MLTPTPHTSKSKYILRKLNVILYKSQLLVLKTLQSIHETAQVSTKQKYNDAWKTSSNLIL